MNTFCFMPRPQPRLGTGVLALLLGLTGSASAAPTPTSAYGKLPFSFEPNQGQSAPEVRFLARGPGYQLFLTPQEAVLALHKTVPKAEAGKATPARPTPTEGAVVRMHLEGAHPHPSISGHVPLPGKVNYLRGKDPKQWRTDIPTYEKVKYTHVYPGIDLVYYGRERQLEYDFIVAPGADPKAIALTFSGGELQLTASGDLVLATATGDVRFQAPVLYQTLQGRKQLVAGKYVRRGERQISFEVGAYDATQPLVIDPVLSYSTYLGGSGGDPGNDIAVDAHGQTYVTGSTHSADFPTHRALQPVLGSTYLDEEERIVPDAYIAKLNAAGSTLLYSTYLGGSGIDISSGIAVDSHGQVYVTGVTDSDDFPTQRSLQPVRGGGSDAFVVKLNAAGNTLVYSTYLGGNTSDWGHSIAVDSRGQVYVAGQTDSDDFPTTRRALQPAYGGSQDAFVTKLNAVGTAFVYSTYLGGKDGDSGHGLAVDARGNAYVTGSTFSDDFPTTRKALQPAYGGNDDAFVAKLNAVGTAFVYSTYLGGSSGDGGIGIAVDTHGNAYVTGGTDSDDFPTTRKALQPVRGGIPDEHGFLPLDAFVAKLNAAGSVLLYSTYLGGKDHDSGRGIAVDARGNAYVTGETGSDNFPTTRKALQPVLGSIPNEYGSVPPDAFVAKLNAAGSILLYSTYLGGGASDWGDGIAVDSWGNVYAVGSTESEDFPTTRKALQPEFGGGFSDAFVAKITELRPQPRRK